MKWVAAGAAYVAGALIVGAGLEMVVRDDPAWSATFETTDEESRFIACMALTWPVSVPVALLADRFSE